MKNLRLTDDGYVIKNDVAVGYYGDKHGKTMRFPEGICGIDAGAVQHSPTTTRVEIPEGVEEIRELCFAGFSSLERIELPISLKYIGNRAFQGCKNLKDIYIPSGVEFMGENVFTGTSVTMLNIPDEISLKVRGICACSNISRIILSSRVLERFLLHSDASPFGLCDLKELVIDDTKYNADEYYESYYKNGWDTASIKVLWGTPFVERLSLRTLWEKNGIEPTPIGA